MGTHPIFESVFDCLTEKRVGKMMNQDSSQLRKKLDQALSDSPYVDPEFEFGEENAKLYNEIQSRIPFVVSDIKHQFFGKYMAKMYRCMATCEDDQSLTSMDRVQDCLNVCRDTFLNPKRQIVEAEVNRLHWMMNRELDLCVDRARFTIDQPDYNPEDRRDIESQYQSCNQIALKALETITNKFLKEKLSEKLTAAESDK